MRNFILQFSVYVLLLPSLLWGQSAEDPVEQLVYALNHRRPEAREMAFEALLTRASQGESVDAAKSELLKFANMQHAERYGKREAQEYQQQALKILVQVDDDVKNKVITRTQELVKAYELLLPRKDSSAKDIYKHILKAIEILKNVKEMPTRKTVGNLAIRVFQLNSTDLNRPDSNLLLQVIYRKFATSTELINYVQSGAFDFKSLKSRAYNDFLFAFYNTPIDDQAIEFITKLPGSDHADQEYKTRAQAYLIGVLAKRFALARTKAFRLAHDQYESRDVRVAACSGILASTTPGDAIYWEVDKLFEENRWSYYETLKLGFDFSEENRKTIHREKFDKKKIPVSLPPKKTNANNAKEDAKEYHSLVIPLLRQIQSKIIAGQVIPQIPRNVYQQMKVEAAEARKRGEPGVAELFDATRKTWDDSIANGLMVIVD